MGHPLVSIILPTHNRAKTLSRAIESVLSQTIKDFELIIVDDGSTDETSAIFRSYARHKQVRLISRSHQGGCAAARNLGVSASVGRYIAFQDSDDEWLTEKLEKAVASLEGVGSEVGVFYSDMLRVEKDGNAHYLKAPDVQRGVLSDQETLEYKVYGIGIVSTLIKRECFDKVGLFDEALSRFIDLELFIRLSDHFDFFHREESLVKYYAMDGISTNLTGLIEARRYLLEKYYQQLKQEKVYLAYQYLQLAFALFETGDKRETYKFALTSLLICPRQPKIREATFRLIERLGSNYSKALLYLKSSDLSQITVKL